MDQKEIDDIVHIVADSQNIKEYTLFKGDEESIGTSYFGNLVAVKICGVKDNESVYLDVLIKVPPDNEFLRSEGPVTLMYEREIFVYSTLLPAYRRICGEFVSPVCYYIQPEPFREVLALQDMRSQGYKLKDGLFFDLEHSVMAIKTIAKFHAISLAIKTKDPVFYEEIQQKCWSLFNDNNETKVFLKLLAGCLKKTSSAIGGKTGDILGNIGDDIHAELERIEKNTKIRVVCHSDLWKNNILFKYQNGRPTSVCLVDYQTTQLGSAAYDLLYFITTTVEPELRKEKMDKLVATYHKTLNECLRTYGQPGELLEDLKMDLTTVGRVCVAVATHSFKNWFGILDQNVFNKNLSTDENDIQSAQEIFKKTITDIVTDYRSFDYI